MEEADHYEALARKRSSSRTRPSDFEPIVISDDEEEERTKSTFNWSPTSQPQCPSGFPDPASVGGQGWKPPVDHDGPLPQIQSLAVIAPGQGYVDPNPNTVKGVLLQLENALKQAISILGVRWGTYADCHPVLVSCLGEVRRVGGDLIAMRCDRKLAHWESLALRVEALSFGDPFNEVARLIGETRVRIMREREARAKRISEQEAIVENLRERQNRLFCDMDVHPSTIARADTPPIPRRPTLEGLRRASTDVHRAFSKASQVLRALHREEEASIAALSEEKLEKEAEAQAQANRAKELATLRAELASFTVLDCAE